MTFTVFAIAPDVLNDLRGGSDGLGNRMVPFAASGGEPLRCCLRRAGVDESIALVSYSPTPVRGPWTQYGPVFVHVDECEGYREPDVLPADLGAGPRVPRAYRADGSMADDANVRTLVPQCFLFTVRLA